MHLDFDITRILPLLRAPVQLQIKTGTTEEFYLSSQVFHGQDSSREWGGCGGRPSIGPFTPSPPLPPPRENLFAQMESFFSFPGVPRCRCIQNKPSTIYPSKPIVPLQQDSGALRTGSGLFVSPAPHFPPEGSGPDTQDLLQEAMAREVRREQTVMLCHSEPGAWTPAPLRPP